MKNTLLLTIILSAIINTKLFAPTDNNTINKNTKTTIEQLKKEIETLKSNKQKNIEQLKKNIENHIKETISSSTINTWIAIIMLGLAIFTAVIIVAGVTSWQINRKFEQEAEEARVEMRIVKNEIKEEQKETKIEAREAITDIREARIESIKLKEEMITLKEKTKIEVDKTKGEMTQEKEKHLEEIEVKIKNQLKKINELTAEQLKENPETIKKIIEEAKKKPLANIDKVRLKALELQGQGQIEKAIKIWESIANITENNKEKTKAYFSTGYLYTIKTPPDYDKAIEAYSKAIQN